MGCAASVSGLGWGPGRFRMGLARGPRLTGLLGRTLFAANGRSTRGGKLGMRLAPCPLTPHGLTRTQAAARAETGGRTHCLQTMQPATHGWPASASVPPARRTRVPSLRAVLEQEGEGILFHDFLSAQHNLPFYKFCIKSNYGPADGELPPQVTLPARL